VFAALALPAGTEAAALAVNDRDYPDERTVCPFGSRSGESLTAGFAIDGAAVRGRSGAAPAAGDGLPRCAGFATTIPSTRCWNCHPEFQDKPFEGPEK
jgi:hypothetical protein